MIETDVKTYQALLRPINDVDPCGGGISTTQITAVSVGEWFPPFGANIAGGAVRVHTQKLFAKNNHASDDLLNASFYISNAITNHAPGSVVKVTVPNSTDATNTTVTLFGFDSAGNFQTEVISIAGFTTAITGAKVFSGTGYGLVAAMLSYTDVGGNKILTLVDVTLADSDSVTIGTIPVGMCSAIGFIDFWRENSLDDTNQIANRLTVPPAASSTYGLPVSAGTAMAFANSGTLTHGSAQGIWGKLYVPAGLYNLIDWNIGLEILGESSA